MPRYACLAILAVAPILTSQQLDMPKTDAWLERVASDDRSIAHLVVVVDGGGRRFVRAAGHADLDADRPFEDWTPVPLGRLTRAITLAGFDDACARRALSPDGRIGDAVDDLREDVAALTWDAVLGESGGGLPGYLRYVAPGQESRALGEVLHAHAFLPDVESAWREPRSMTPWALVQAALERELEKPWPEIVRTIAADSFGMRGVRDTRGLPEHVLVKRHLSDGTVVGRWLAEVPAAGGAVATGTDLVRLLDAFHDEDRRLDGLLDAREGFADAFDRPYRAGTIDVPGTTGTLRYYPGARLAVFVFVAQQGSRAVDDLHTTVLADLFAPAEEVVEAVLEGRFGGGVIDRDRTIVGRWKATVTRLGDAVPIEIDVGLRTAVRVRVADGEFVTADGLRRWGTAVRGEFRSGRLTPDDWEESWRLMVGHADGALVGYAVLRAFHRDLGEVERLPYPVRFERVEDR